MKLRILCEKLLIISQRFFGIPPFRFYALADGIKKILSKTSIKQARTESFDFLGYTFGPHCFQPDGRWYLGASPSKKSVARIKQKVGDLLMPNNVEAWSEVRDRLNQILRGWCAYFRYGTTAQAYQAVDYYVYEIVRHYLRRRHQVQSRGTNSCFSRNAVYGRLGVVPLRRVRMASRS